MNLVTHRSGLVSTVLALLLAMPGAASAATVPFFDSESNGSSLRFDTASVVFASVKGAGFDADEHLAAVEIVTTTKDTGGKPVAKREVLATLCQRRTLIMLPATGQRFTAEGLKFDSFSTTTDTRIERLRFALCEGELSGVPPPRQDGRRSGWLHVLEGDRQALYSVLGGSAALSPRHVATRVRLYQLGDAQLVDGRRYSARDAVWVIDCQERQGAVLFERYWARNGEQVTQVATMGDEAFWKKFEGIDTAALKYAAATPGSIQARYTDDLCAVPARKGR